MFFNNISKKLREQENYIYSRIRSGDKIPEIEEYFDIYLGLMGKYSGNEQSQLLVATIFAKYIKTFILGESKHLSNEKIGDMRAAAKRMLLGMRDGIPYGSGD
jgi:hypothetical protein